LLNGNFDMGDYSATLSLDASLQVAPTGNNSSLDLSFSAIVPGWSLHGGNLLLAGPMLTSHNQIKAANPDFAQGGGKGGNNFAWRLGCNGDDATHNRFLVPDWGALRFDLYVPKDANKNSQLKDDNPKKLTVNLIDANGTTVVTQPVLLQAAKGTAAAYSDDRWRIGYGETGFET
jgi:hypothetical protein